MKVMVLGATGFIGPPLMEALAALGHEPLGVARNLPGRSEHPVLTLDRRDPPAIANAAETEWADVVVDLLALTLGETRPLLAALGGRISRYVLASSGDVYRRYNAIQRREPDPDPSRRLAEDAPLRTLLHPYRGEARRPVYDPDAWLDDYDKIPIEDAVARANFPSVIARLPMVWGPRDRGRRFAWAIQPMLRGEPAVEMDDAWAAWRSTYGYVDDVAHALALCATHGQASGVYNLGADEAPDHAHWAERFAATIGWTGALRRVGREAAPSPFRERLDAMDLSIPMVTDTTKIRKELGFSEPTDAADALERTAADEAALLID
jgi:nucleoside-diphosphate-sugar epimerase